MYAFLFLSLYTPVVLDHQWSISQEVELEKLVGDEPLRDDHGEIELLAAEEPESVRVVFVL